ncbi:MAG: NAD-dependent succinate-semialdehyde dehydrogenase [Rhizobiaceae bacterium]
MNNYPEIKFFVGGQWVAGVEHMPIVNPATDEQIGSLPLADNGLLDDAISAAQDGFKTWCRFSPMQRGQIMRHAAQLMRERSEEIANSIALELGKPIQQARAEVIRGCEFFEWDAAEGQRLYGRVIPGSAGIRHMVIRQPIGPVAAFSPWNFPMSQPARKIAGALAAGCSVVLKPAEETPAGAVHIAKAFEDAGLPAGVLNLVFGVPSDISGHLIPNDKMRLVAFTGSTAVGRHLTNMASQHMTPVLMELGGHAPVIVCDDVDPRSTAQLSAVRKMRNSGQVCTSPTRFFVAENLHASFAEHFVAKVNAMKMGDPLDSETEIGPLAHKGRLEAVQTFVDDAVERGATLLAGGQRHPGEGYFFQPTVLSNVPDDALIMHEEPFGPVAILNTVESVEEAIEKANSVAYGLAAYGFTHSAANADMLVEGIEAGNLSINTLEASLPETPFGGVKSSGYGREGGDEGLHHYTVVKNVSHKMQI